MPGAFLYDNRATTASLTSPVTVAAAMPLSNLLDPQPRMRARFGSGGGNARIVVDLGGQVPVNAVFLGSTTAGPEATVRVRLATTDATGTTGDAWNTGVLQAETGPECNGQVVILAALGAGTGGGGTEPLTMDATDWDMSSTEYTMDMTVRPASSGGVSIPVGRYLQVDLVDLTRATIDIGILAVGVAWQPAVGMLYGMREGRQMMGRVDTNAFTGARFSVPALVNPRLMTFTLPMLSNATTVAAHRDLVQRLGSAGDALWIPEITDGLAERNRRSIWGTVNPPGEAAMLEHVNFARVHRSFRMEERL